MRLLIIEIVGDCQGISGLSEVLLIISDSSDNYFTASPALG